MPLDDLKSNLEALRKRIKDDFRKEKAYLERLFEEAPEAIAVIDVDGRVLHVNNEFTEVFGYAPEEVHDRFLDELITPEKLERQAEWTAERTKKGERVNLETIRRRKDGSLLHISLIMAPIVVDEEQSSTYVIMRDITRRRLMEDEVRRGKAYLEHLFESSQEAIAMTDNEGRIMQLNSEFTRLFGYSMAESMGFPLDDLIAVEGAAEEAREITRKVSEGTRITTEGLRRRKDGEHIHVSVVAAPVIVEGMQVGTYGIYRDNADLVLFQERLREAQKLESLGILAGGVAPDMYDFLAAIQGKAEEVLSNLPDGSPVRDDVAEIIEAADGAARLCRLVRDPAGDDGPPTRVLNVSELVRKLGTMLRRYVAENADFAVEPASHLPGARLNAARFAQVLMNLVLNASEALDGEPGGITLRTGVQELDETFLRDCGGGDGLAPGAYVLVEVADTGPGIDRKTMDCLFDPSFTTGCAGRGQGLPNVLDVMKSMGGAIKVNSVPGEGSTFSVFFPASESKE